MSHAQDPSVADDELRPSETQGYKVGEKKTAEEYAQMDANDESLQVSDLVWRTTIENQS